MAFYRIRLRQVYKTAREIQNEFHVEDPTSLIAPETIAGIIAAHWIPEFRWSQVSQLQYFKIEVTRILVPDPLATFLQDINILGLQPGTGDYGFHAWHIVFTTDLLGPRHRGGYFIGGLAPGFQSVQNENMNASCITNMNAMVLNLRNKFCEPGPSTGLNLVIAHKNDSTPTRVSNISYNTFLTTMRSRKFFHGI